MSLPLPARGQRPAARAQIAAGAARQRASGLFEFLDLLQIHPIGDDESFTPLAVACAVGLRSEGLGQLVRDVLPLLALDERLPLAFKL